jgi:hypothetical protein
MGRNYVVDKLSKAPAGERTSARMSLARADAHRVFVPFFAFAKIGRVLGLNTLGTMFFSKRGAPRKWGSVVSDGPQTHNKGAHACLIET